MKISELSKASGVPLPTVKFYLREGLLQAGEVTGPNQARYGPAHLRRLRFVRTLRDVGGLSIASIREVVAAIENEEAPLWEIMGVVVDALGGGAGIERVESTEREAATREVDGFLAGHGLPVRAGALARENLVDALLAIRGAFGMPLPVETFVPYERAVRELAEQEAALVRSFMAAPGIDRMAVIEFVVFGTILFEPVLLAFRRMWNEKATEPAPGAG